MDPNRSAHLGVLQDILALLYQVQSQLLLRQGLHRVGNVLQDDLPSPEIPLSLFVEISGSIRYRAANLCPKLVDDAVFEQVVYEDDLSTMGILDSRK